MLVNCSNLLSRSKNCSFFGWKATFTSYIKNIMVENEFLATTWPARIPTMSEKRIGYAKRNGTDRPGDRTQNTLQLRFQSLEKLGS